MTKRGNNEGTIYFDKSVDRWRGAVKLPDGRRPTVSGRTREDVAAKLVKMQASLISGVPVTSSEHLGPFLDWWLGTLEAKVSSGYKSPNTLDNARWAVDTWLKPCLGGRRLRDLEPEDVEGLLARMSSAGKGRSSMNRVRSYLGQALAAAERRGKVSRNVARIAEMPATKQPSPRRALTPNEATKLLDAASGHRLEGLVITGLMLGLRPGELTGLRWVDIDLDAGRLTVGQSMKSERNGLRAGDTKTAKSRRLLTLPGPVIDALKAHRRRQLEETMKARFTWRETGLVFTTEIGSPLDPSNLRSTFGRITEKAGLGHWTPNELRHSAASLLSAAGVPLEAIADVLGHSSTRMLEKHYRHQVKPSIDAHVDAMEAIFGT